MLMLGESYRLLEDYEQKVRTMGDEYTIIVPAGTVGTIVHHLNPGEDIPAYVFAVPMLDKSGDPVELIIDDEYVDRSNALKEHAGLWICPGL